ncbi:hypothetical protein G7Y89_g15385 [Cudoniella acicularis]|uniref:Uncharacterized protein n=1 Tax=Cudoniella acicularis TaxID=354080 RepID=A0A8H4VLW4_9HELO|nr:hypothetical protein G7Y89_g15385 [Cudoniella acicularis]
MDFKYASLQPGCYKKPPFSVEAPGYKPVEGETIPRRNPSCAQGLKAKPEEGVNTVFDVLLRASEKFENLRAIGTRKHIKTHNEIKKTVKIVDGKEVEVSKNWTYFELGEFEYLTYGQYVTRALQIGAGYRQLGLTKEDRLHVFASTSANWLISAHAAVTQSIPIVTSYATLGEEGLEVSLVQTHAKAIFVDPDLIPKLFNPLKKAAKLEILIYNNNIDVVQAHLSKLEELYPNIRIFSLEEVQQLGENNLVEPVPPQPDDLCCLMYTSGTTGEPKGVPLKHRNIVAAIAGLESIFHPFVRTKDAVLCYLPLAHSFEFAFENACLYWGLKMGYGNPRTLSDTSMRNCKGDIKEFRPTILIGVPAIWETIRKGIEQKVSQLGFIKSHIFWSALVLKAFLCKWRLPGSGLLDALVFNAVKQETGGKLRACFNGAGPIGKETRRFISYAIVPLLMGYGLTETMAMGALMDPLEWDDETLGDIPGCIEIKLVDFAEAGYFSTNNPPQGEILIRGDAVMDGYYQNEEENAKALTRDRWFRTGDIGEWAPNGHLKIIDRKKNLVKTLNGEYIALEKLESIYRTNNLISNICVYAAADRAKPIAIVFPALKALQEFADSKGREHNGLNSLVQNPIIKGLVLKELQTTARKADLAPFEIIEGIVLTDYEWTAQNGLLTPAHKLISDDVAFEVLRTALECGANVWNGADYTPKWRGSGIFSPEKTFHVYGTPEANTLHLMKRYFTKYPEDADKVVLCIKSGLVSRKDFQMDCSAKGMAGFLKNADDILAGTKKIDIFGPARVDPNVPIEDTIAGLVTLIQEGKITGIQLTEVSSTTIQRASKIHPIAMVEAEVSLWSRDIFSNDVASTCASLGIVISGHTPLGAGQF